MKVLIKQGFPERRQVDSENDILTVVNNFSKSLNRHAAIEEPSWVAGLGRGT